MFMQPNRSRRIPKRDEPIITKIEVWEYEWILADVGLDPSGAIPTYRPGDRFKQRGGALKIHTDVGLVGEFVGFSPVEAMTLPLFTHALLGHNALERERVYRDLKLASRQLGRVGLGIVDIALWDLAGKFYDAPIYRLLGGYRTELPCYASTMNGGEEGGLDTPEAFADFAEQCLELGYPAYKIHPWPGGPLERHEAVVRVVGQRVGDKMALMLDPFCYYQTFGEALRVGRVCDEQAFFWLEDPYADGGISQFGHAKLRELIKTPLLQGEHIRSLEPHVDLMIAKGTDFVRGDVIYDGITGTMKIAHAAEGLGLDIEYHGCGPAQRHVMAATRNSNYYEVVWVHPQIPDSNAPIYQDGYQDGLYAIDQTGCVSVPHGPGLGIMYDWDWIEKHQVAHRAYRLED
jgi:L-alanine-DL-glutamate epimerase-like enolase superfamily enzyme